MISAKKPAWLKVPACLVVIASDYQLDNVRSYLKAKSPEFAEDALIVDRRNLSRSAYFLTIIGLWFASIFRPSQVKLIIVGDRRSLSNRLAHFIFCRQRIIVSDGIGDELADYYYDDSRLRYLAKRVIFGLMPSHEFMTAVFAADLSQKNRNDEIWIIGQCLSERGDMDYDKELDNHRKLAKGLRSLAQVIYFQHPKDAEEKLAELGLIYDKVRATSGFETYVQEADTLPQQIIVFYSTVGLNMVKMGYDSVCFVILDGLVSKRRDGVQEYIALFRNAGLKQLHV